MERTSATHNLLSNYSLHYRENKKKNVAGWLAGWLMYRYVLHSRLAGKTYDLAYFALGESRGGYAIYESRIGFHLLG